MGKGGVSLEGVGRYRFPFGIWGTNWEYLGDKGGDGEKEEGEIEGGYGTLFDSNNLSIIDEVDEELEDLVSEVEEVVEEEEVRAE